MKKLLFVVIDGAADTPVSALGGKTPLEIAKKPNINNLSRMGTNGLMQVLPIPPESDEAVLSLLGYDVFDVYTGRGPLEAVGGGADFQDGDIAIRCNFGSMENGVIKNVRMDDFSSEDAKKLEWAINEFVKLTNAEFVFRSTAKYRGVLVIKSKEKLSPKITNTHPGYIVRPMTSIYGEVPVSSAVANPDMVMRKVIPMERTKEAAFTAEVVNEFIKKSAEVLKNHPLNIERKAQKKAPANIIITRDAGDRLPKLFSFSKTYDVHWACFAEMPVEKGIAQLSGMELIPMPEASGDVRKDYWIWAQTLIKNIQLYDAVYVHLKGPDIFAHMGDYQGKIQSIENIDKYFFEPVLKRIDLQNTIIVVTCDHTTSCESKSHTDAPVPLTIAGPDIFPDNVSGFSERSCANGAMKSIRAMDLMPMLMKFVKR
ncbi:MAG: alkaline phosphatase family protein [Candidatus Nanoarchaeia archaeon]|nr:alkaline phosphatase family protein [Candidatus Nanoarchaeia archaeon]MDD5239439.1 alkaline phosphatase family protein [Candidatus Nanoarchaeia archaeon]